MTTLQDAPQQVAGVPRHRLEGGAKVSGAARYAAEYPLDGLVHAWPVLADIASGRITAVDEAAVTGMAGVLGVLWHGNAPRLQEPDTQMLNQLQDDVVHFRGEVVALVVATTPEQAREAAARLPVTFVARDHAVELREDDPDAYVPEEVNAGFPSVSEIGDPDGAFAASPVRFEATYATPGLHNNPMEMHATTAAYVDGLLTVYDSNQGGSGVQRSLAAALGLPPEHVRVVTEHIGGGFGSKGTARPNVVLAAMATMTHGVPVRLVLTRQHEFALVGYRTPTISTFRLGADRDGRLRSITHEVTVQTSRHEEFVEQAAVPTRHMYAAPDRRTRHHAVPLDVPIPSWMRAPGECPGMYALESAMDELAAELSLDPIELRIRNEPEVDPEEGTPFSSRHLVDCLRRGAELFGWDERAPRPRAMLDGRELVGLGVASSIYPAMVMPASASATATPDGRFRIAINATDIGTGGRTALAVLAAEVLGVGVDAVDLHIGHSDLPEAGVAGGSSGTSSWGWAVHKACRSLLDEIAGRGGRVDAPITVDASTADDIQARPELARFAFGAQFVEARVDVDTGEIRVPRILGVFAAGRIVNPITARSQFLGGMTMGLGMALMEHGEMDPAFGDYANHDLASYHVPVCADVRDMQAHWLDERDDDLNPMGTKGIGEIGIVGTAAAVTNAVFHATGIRVRSLPVLPEDMLLGTAR
ncbi:xanthine dehydrogenase family protein molybdopterin-binding subunit [Nakamurella leprariae]|uniref:Xanthine dehydrogenase family protein molybdopterin-binding subunit n=1 Tax=Nakamurella leprariae TaxID=2803911 RepID=A0A938YES9_9ACTN|nr:xanthine dehydrogenase family protein molybdopterin-binding subunit [Nakamurella leprariae]MBM9468529.1 xanthine dehydrogenase family protein molybdopterin-binding subunit [Nakamurella leprariae]